MKVQHRTVRSEQVLRHDEPPAYADPLRGDAPPHRALCHNPTRDDCRGRAQYVVIKKFKLRVMPEAPGIAPGHTHYMRQACNVRNEMARHPVGLQILRKDYVEWTLSINPRRQPSEL